MKCPTLRELPPPPAGKTGWPWTEESLAAPDDGGVWPRVSIITPSFKQGQFIEETIRSVLLQGYPDLEYFVIDGGSNDGTVEVLRKYERWLTGWTSERDRGQSHAINKGLARVTGSIWNWINSDDLLMPDALRAVAAAHGERPRALIVGDVLDFWTGTDKRRLVRQGEIELRKFVEFWNREANWHQPGIFFPTYLRDEVGLLDESLRYLFDYDLLCRATAVAPATHYLHQTVSSFRLHDDSKTVSQGDHFMFELFQISQRYWHTLSEVDRTGYRRHAAGLLFCTGCQRLVHGRAQAFRFIGAGLRTHPWWAVRAAVGLLPTWLRRKSQAAGELA